jgi:hypothetical protein
MDRASVLVMAPLSARERGDRGRDASPAPIPAEGLAIVCPVCDQRFRPRAWTPSSTRHSDRGQGGFKQGAFLRLRTRDMQPGW